MWNYYLIVFSYSFQFDLVKIRLKKVLTPNKTERLNVELTRRRANHHIKEVTIFKNGPFKQKLLK